MPLRQDRVVLTAHVVAESAWVFALAGIIGTFADFDSSPLSWYGVAGVLGLSVLLSRLTPRKGENVEVLYALMAVLGLMVVYVAVALHVEPGQIRPAWPLDWLINDAAGGYTSRGVFGAILGALLWWRGTRVASNEFPTDDLAFTFRVGMVVLVVALIFDLNTDVSLSTFPMVFLFFGSSLIGLSAGHLLEESRRSADDRTWLKAIGATVAAITTFGLLIALINRGVLSFLAKPATVALEALFRGILWGIIAPIAFFFDVIVSWLISFLNLFQGEREQPPEEEINPEIQGFLQTLQEEQEAASEGITLLLQIIEFALVAIVVAIVVLVLGKAFRRVLRGRARSTEGQRDSVAQDANPVMDVAKLALRLVPDVLKRPPRKGYRVPDGPPGIVDAFRLYYDMLDTAEEHGITRRKHDTPTEFQGRVEGTFPDDVVRPSTESFNLAIYADVPADRSVIRRLRQGLRDATLAIRRQREEEDKEEEW
ncbi:MAG: DUF4129 domain-containing protein [Chloroflexi bacterium]|nr:DUF4129 domain-containing protein [Chloroflexota bacterium]